MSEKVDFIKQSNFLKQEYIKKTINDNKEFNILKSISPNKST
jgi:hypothetical protein